MGRVPAGPVAPLQGKIEHRPWFTPEEYKELYTATREYAKVARAQDQWRAEQVHDFVLFMANTGLRPDEAKNLQHRDVKVVQDRDTNQRILDRGARQARRGLLQKHAGRGAAVSAAAEARDGQFRYLA